MNQINLYDTKLATWGIMVCTVGDQKSWDTFFFEKINRIISLSSDRKKTQHSLLDSPKPGASNGGILKFLALIDKKLSIKVSKP